MGGAVHALQMFRCHGLCRLYGMLRDAPASEQWLGPSSGPRSFGPFGPCSDHPAMSKQNNSEQWWSINQSIYIYRKNVNSMTIGYWCVRVHLSVRVRVCICIYMNLYVLYMLLMCTSICMIMYDHVQQYETCIHVHVHCCVGTWYVHPVYPVHPS